MFADSENFLHVDAETGQMDVLVEDFSGWRIANSIDLGREMGDTPLSREVIEEVARRLCRSALEDVVSEADGVECFDEMDEEALRDRVVGLASKGVACAYQAICDEHEAPQSVIDRPREA